MFAKYGKPILLGVAIIIYVALIAFPYSAAQAASPRLVPSQPIYPIWRTGGLVAVTASQLVPNAAYYVWLQGPMNASGRYTGTRFLGINGTIPLSINVTRDDPPGTYRISLSNSNATDTRAAEARFGVFGADANTYKRTDKVLVIGGGVTPNSIVSPNVTSGQNVVSGYPPFVSAGPNGDFNFTFRLSPSTPLGALIITLKGTTFDNRTQPFTVSTAVNVYPTSVSINRTQQPPSSIERTDNVVMAFQLKYPDGSPVTTASPTSSLVTVLRNLDQKVIIQVPLTLLNASAGIWTATWVPPPSANLTSYHFTYQPSVFNDSYGNRGQGASINSSDVQVKPANVVLSIQANTVNATIQRTQTIDVTIVPKYHDGSDFLNVTQMTGHIIDAGAKTYDLNFSRTSNAYVAHLKVLVNATLGNWTVSSNVNDIFGNKGAGGLTFEVIKADIKFTVDAPAQIERAALYNVTADVTYPDGSILGPGLLSPGYAFNLTISLGNLTIQRPMSFNSTTGLWEAQYQFVQNATLGQYAVQSNVTDVYTNFGLYSSTAQVIPAVFRFFVAQPKIKAEPSVQVPIIVLVAYPNGTALSPKVNGTVSALLTNSSGTFTFPMSFNATGGIWNFIYIAPNPGLSFGTTVNFGFQANDPFGNAGMAAKVIEVDVGAPIQALILTTIIAALVPASLLGWAIITVAGRRRKHKP